MKEKGMECCNVERKEKGVVCYVAVGKGSGEKGKGMVWRWEGSERKETIVLHQRESR